jgi:hypothetical protein
MRWNRLRRSIDGPGQAASSGCPGPGTAKNPNQTRRRPVAAVEGVGRAVGQVKVTCQVRPILLDGLQRRLPVHARNVLHDEKPRRIMC